ncbi:MAG: hypothetical protein ACKVU4_09215 [Phycisphaerales bacterium]
MLFSHSTSSSIGDRLFVGGYFGSVGGLPIRAIAAWNGAAWTMLAQGLAQSIPGTFPKVHALASHDDDGRGPRPPGLYVGGGFKYAGGLTVNNIARWDGAVWDTLDSGLQGTVEALGVFDVDGPGPQLPSLFAGGQFIDTSQGVFVHGLARWDGRTWHAIPGWNNGWGKAMAVFDDDGPGPNKPALFVGGSIGSVNGILASHIAKWDGQQWSALSGIGVFGWGGLTSVRALAVLDEDGDGPNPGGLYVGGFFSSAGGVPAMGLARWGCPAPAQCYANCNLDFHPITGAHLLSIADFGCFQGKYVLGDVYADCNASGTLTVADFGCFQGKYVLGCP